MARLPWKPGEREKAEEIFNKTGSVFGTIRNGLMGLPGNKEVKEDRNARKSGLTPVEQARANEALRNGKLVVAKLDRDSLSQVSGQQSIETDKEVNSRRPLGVILAEAKENNEERLPKKAAHVIIAEKKTPNERIVQIIKPRTSIEKLPGYKEEVMPDGSIVSSKDKENDQNVTDQGRMSLKDISEQSQENKAAEGTGSVPQVRLKKEDREPR